MKEKKPTFNEVFTKMVNDRLSMVSMNSSYAAIIFAALANAPLFMAAAMGLVVANTSQAFRKASYELRNNA